MSILFSLALVTGRGAREKRFLLREIPECSLSPGGVQYVPAPSRSPKNTAKKVFFDFMNVYNELGKGKVQTPRPKDL